MLGEVFDSLLGGDLCNQILNICLHKSCCGFTRAKMCKITVLHSNKWLRAALKKEVAHYSWSRIVRLSKSL